VDKKIKDLEPFAEESDVNILGLVRRGKQLPGSAREEIIRKNDLVVLEGRPDAIDQFVGAADLEYVGAYKHDSMLAEAVALMDIAQAIGLSRRSVQDALAWLARRKLITVSRESITAVPVYTVLRPWCR
jgi:hypothetical protein